MKKCGTTIGIILSAVGILLLLGLGVYLTLDWRNTLSGSGAPQAEQTADASVKTDGTGAAGTPAEAGADSAHKENGTDSQTAAALAALQAADAPLPQHHIIFVGDSRTVGMGEAEAKTDDACSYIGAVGEGYHWFADSGMAQMEAAMEQYPHNPVVLNLGVNDMDMIDSYLELYGTFPEKYPETRFYFMSVNPVTDEAAHVTNEEIASFNSKLRAAFPEAYLDCSTYLRIKEFESVDGVHYSQETYRIIHDFTVRKVWAAAD